MVVWLKHIKTTPFQSGYWCCSWKWTTECNIMLSNSGHIRASKLKIAAGCCSLDLGCCQESLSNIFQQSRQLDTHPWIPRDMPDMTSSEESPWTIATAPSVEQPFLSEQDAGVQSYGWNCEYFYHLWVLNNDLQTIICGITGKFKSDKWGSLFGCFKCDMYIHVPDLRNFYSHTTNPIYGWQWKI